jgi:hypothetical protein
MALFQEVTDKRVFKEGDIVSANGEIVFFINKNDDGEITILNPYTRKKEVTKEIEDCNFESKLYFSIRHSPTLMSLVDFNYKKYYILTIGKEINSPLSNFTIVDDVVTMNEVLGVSLFDLIYNETRIKEYENEIKLLHESKDPKLIYKLGTMYANGFTSKGKKIRSLDKAFELFSRQKNFISLKIVNLKGNKTELNNKKAIIASNGLYNGRLRIKIFEYKNQIVSINPDNVLFIEQS